VEAPWGRQLAILELLEALLPLRGGRRGRPNGVQQGERGAREDVEGRPRCSRAGQRYLLGVAAG
jgi:hypothetical protein